MQYIELTFNLTPNNEAACDVLAALLADTGCETFVPSETGQTAYILREQFDEDSIKAAICSFREYFPQVDVSYTYADAPDENWNATWESEHLFEPIDLPDGQQIQIIPRQAFGSGEHATTRMMLSLLATSDPSGKTVIDAGCGTGVLGIAALKLGANHVFAYDIDDWSVRNAEDNFVLNGLATSTHHPSCPVVGNAIATPTPSLPYTSATIALGNASCLDTAPQADILLANINLNILLSDIPAFTPKVKEGGLLLLSGFLEADIPALTTCAAAHGFQLIETQSDAEWRALKFLKS